MINDPYKDLPAAKRRRLVVWTLLSTTVLVVLYYVLPLDEPWNGDTAVRILIGLVAFAGITVWQVRIIAGARYPAVKAIEALGPGRPFYPLLFASTYFVMERASAANFTQPLTRTDALYFAVTVFSTVGFGDIAAKSDAARVVLIFQMLGDLALLGAGARVLLGNLSSAAATSPVPAVFGLLAGSLAGQGQQFCAPPRADPLAGKEPGLGRLYGMAWCERGHSNALR